MFVVSPSKIIDKTVTSKNIKENERTAYPWDKQLSQWVLND
jgi:hypothetical protein